MSTFFVDFSSKKDMIFGYFLLKLNVIVNKKICEVHMIFVLIQTMKKHIFLGRPNLDTYLV